MLTLENIINTSVATIITATGWLIKKLHSDMGRLREEFHDMEIKLPEKYLMKSDFKEFKNELFARLDRIEGKIERRLEG
ncbi:MAG TPA: hypothetical protein DIV86_04395 [Alphaproteobacteria bacterium]|nr:hypothetical protein [Alphaproteobacteria bacterium]